MSSFRGTTIIDLVISSYLAVDSHMGDEALL